VGALTVAGDTAISGSLSAATTTLTSLTVNGTTILTGSTTIAGLTVTSFNPGLTLGSVPFQGTTGLEQDNANFFYDSTNHRLGLGTSSPTATLFIQSNGANASLTVASTTGAQQLTVSPLGNLGIGSYFSTHGNGVTNGSTTIPSTSLEISYGGDPTYNYRGVFPAVTSTNIPLRITPSINNGFLLSSTGTLQTLIRLDSAAWFGLTQGIGSSIDFGVDWQPTTTQAQIAFYNEIAGSAGAVLQMRGALSSGALDLGVTTGYGQTYINSPRVGPGRYTDSLTSALVLRGNTADSSAGALRVLNSATSTLFAIRNDGRVGIGTIGFGSLLSIAGTSSSPTLALLDIASSSGGSLLRVEANGNVGIGTTSPAAKLTVSGTSTAPTAMLFNVASSTNVSLFNVQSSGNVGIGTTTPDVSLLVAGTHIAGKGLIQAKGIGSAGYISVDTDSPTTQEVGLVFRGTSTYWYMYKPANSGDLRLYDSTADRVTFQNGGNVGIGTTSPAARLQIYPNASNTKALVLQGDNNQSSVIQEWQNSSGTQLLRVNADGSLGFNVVIQNQLTAVQYALTANLGSGLRTYSSTGIELDANTGMAIIRGVHNGDTIVSPTRNDSNNLGDVVIQAGGLERVRFKAAGNVGIGTTSPTALLAITGTSSLPSTLLFNVTSSTNASLFNVQSNGNVGIGTSNPSTTLHVSSTLGGAGFRLQNTSEPSFIFNENGTDNAMIRSTSGALRFFGSGSLNEYMRILSTGNVGIGTTSPLAKLHVEGSANTVQTIIQGNATQTADLQQWQDSTGSILARIQNDGTFRTASSSRIDGGIITPNIGYSLSNPALINFNTANIGVRITSFNAADTGLQIRGVAAQTGDYLRVVDSGASAKFLVDANGNVGVGTTSPSAKLSIKGGGTTTGRAFVITNSADTEKFTVLDNGNVGIGTIAPAEKLSILGSVNIIRANGVAGITLTDPGDKLHNSSSMHNAFGVWVRSDATGQSLYGIDGSSNQYLHLYSSGNKILTLDGSTSGVGIGSTAAYGGIGAKPTNGLIVEGNVGIGTTTVGSRLVIQGTGATSATSAMQINNSAGTGLMTVLNNGNVGIGTTSPATKLEIYDTSPNLRLTSANTSATIGQLEFYGALYPPSTLIQTLGI